jgi:hypothetical protein
VVIGYQLLVLGEPIWSSGNGVFPLPFFVLFKNFANASASRSKR